MIDYLGRWLAITVFCIILWLLSYKNYEDDLVDDRLIHAPPLLMLIAFRHPVHKYIDVHHLVTQILATSLFFAYSFLILLMNDYGNVMQVFSLFTLVMATVLAISISILKRLYGVSQK